MSYRISQLDPLPRINGIEIGRTLGQGTFAVVKLATKTSARSKVFAIKFVHKGIARRAGTREEELGKEIYTHKACSNHPNVIGIYTCGADQHWVWMAMEWAQNGDLFDKIEPDVGVDQEVAHFYFRQLLSAVEFIHAKGVAHRDIKPENILLDGQGNLKVTDFGLACVYKNKQGEKRQAYTACGSPPYMAPEIALEKGYDPQMIDIWSCGVVLFVLLSGETPWEEPTSLDPDFSEFLTNDGKVNSHPWNRFDPMVLSVLRSVLKPDPKKRICMENLRNHPWINQANVFANTEGLCNDTELLTTRLLSQLHIGLTEEDVKKEQNQMLSTKHVSSLVASQPLLEIVDDEEVPMMPMTQEPLTEHIRKKRKLALNSNKDEAILELISKDPAILQFVSSVHVPPHTFFSERLTRFFSVVPVEDLVSAIRDALHRIGMKTGHFTSQISNSDNISIPVHIADRRKLPLRGSIKVVPMSDRVPLSKVEFVRTKADPLEWRRFFKTITILCRDVVYVDMQGST